MNAKMYRKGIYEAENRKSWYMNRFPSRKEMMRVLLRSSVEALLNGPVGGR